jgi:choline kinase
MGLEEVLRDMTAISEAVILMAGEGSRLRGSDNTFLKPFIPLLGRPLISYTLDALIRTGIKKVNFVVGYESGRMIEQVKRLLPSDLSASFIENGDWQKQNGISLLSASGHVSKPFLLAMSDHLFDGAIVDHLVDSYEPGFLNIAVDPKLNSIFDLEDAMKVETRGNRVTAIGKHLREFDAIDTKSDSGGGDCSLADGVRIMAADDKVRAIDIGTAWWQDVDTPQMLRHAEKEMAKRKEQNETSFRKLARLKSQPDTIVF